MGNGTGFVRSPDQFQWVCGLSRSVLRRGTWSVTGSGARCGRAFLCPFDESDEPPHGRGTLPGTCLHCFRTKFVSEMRPRESTSWLTLAPLHVCGCMYKKWRSTRALLVRSCAASSLHPWHVLRFRAAQGHHSLGGTGPGVHGRVEARSGPHPFKLKRDLTAIGSQNGGPDLAR